MQICKYDANATETMASLSQQLGTFIIPGFQMRNQGTTVKSTQLKRGGDYISFILRLSIRTHVLS